MEQIFFAAGILLLPTLCTALGAAGVFLLRRETDPRTQRMLSGMAAGIMLAASVWSLLLPAIQRALSEIVKQFFFSSFRGSISAIFIPSKTS